ncbi:MAG: protein kinase [Candidatus Wallbacteria bacterium]|nr:protein kinase [Candidatus Wallbacteria bacterium]
MAASDLAKYVVKQKVREIGGYLSVFAAHQRKLDRDVELRVLQTLVDESSEMYEKFQAECRALASLDHPGILKVLDLGHAGDRVFYVTDPPPGLPLKEYVSQGQAPPDVAIEVGVQLGQALEYLHARGLVHRGLSLGGINYDLVTGRVVICDFSLLKSSTFNVPSLRDMVDTDTFEALPERAYNWPVDARSDIFLAGSILYALITGEDPLAPASLSRTVDYQFTVPVAKNPECPAELERFILLAAARQPEERFQTAADFVKELEAVRRKLMVKKASRGLPTLMYAGVHPTIPAPEAAAGSEARPAAALSTGTSRRLPAVEPPPRSGPSLPLVAGGVFVAALLLVWKLSSSTAPPEPEALPSPKIARAGSIPAGRVAFKPGATVKLEPGDSAGGAAQDSASQAPPADIHALIEAARAEATSPKNFNARWDTLRAWADETTTKPGATPPISPMELTTVRLKIYREPAEACSDLDDMIKKAEEAEGVKQ